MHNGFQVYTLKLAVQVLLLPNFYMIVTSALRVLDGFDTIDLFEQALHSVCVLG
jgi:hypothetical protein